MNKKILALIAMVLVFALGLTACGCAHKTWNEADCLNPKTCADCGETEGEALGHTWKDATCDTPKTCSRCAATEGAPNGHSWLAATCDTAKTCQICGAVEGEALGHNWSEATCTTPATCQRCHLPSGDPLPHTWVDATTETPKTCSECGTTEGEKINTDPRFTTANTKDLYGEWISMYSLPGAATGMADFETPFEIALHMTLNNDGTATVTASLENAEEVAADLVVYMGDMLYDSLEASAAMSKEDADAYIMDTFGMTMTEYCSTIVDAMDLPHLFDYISINGVYYAADGEFFIGDDWDATMDVSEYILDGDTLTLYEDVFGTGAEETIFIRVTE